jgi:hypothetical protein
MAITLATLEPFPFPLYPSISKNFEGDKGLLENEVREQEGSDAGISYQAAT